MMVDRLLVAVRMQLLDHLYVVRAFDQLMLVVARMRRHDDRLHVRVEVMLLAVFAGTGRLEAVAAAGTVLELWTESVRTWRRKCSQIDLPNSRDSGRYLRWAHRLRHRIGRV